MRVSKCVIIALAAWLGLFILAESRVIADPMLEQAQSASEHQSGRHENSKEIVEIFVEGNGRVSTSAILRLIDNHKVSIGSDFDAMAIRASILALDSLGYFEEIKVYTEPVSGGLKLVFEVLEKPAVTKITVSGLGAIKEDDIRKGLKTELFKIIDQKKVSDDVSMIEKELQKRGYILAQVNVLQEKLGVNEVGLEFKVIENSKILVGDITIVGNEYFSDADIMSFFALKPYTRWSATLGGAPNYHQDLVNRDAEVIRYLYKKAGFADVKVGQPVVVMDPGRRFVRLTYEVTEGLQYSVKGITVSGDVGEAFYSPEVLLKKMTLKENAFFDYTKFVADIEYLVEKYGDLGYAFVDVYPRMDFDKEAKTVEIDYVVTRGQKVYFGSMDIIGNSKTRDNVIRRELEVGDGELYSGTMLNKSKKNINRLGYFEEVQVFKERRDDLLDIKIKVKEKATGNLLVSGAVSPGGQSSEWFTAQGHYEEKNQFGRGWSTNLNGKLGGRGKNWLIEAGFYNPRVDDSAWSLGIDGAYRMEEVRYPANVTVSEGLFSFGGRVGRDLFERVRGFFSYRYSNMSPFGDRVDAYIIEKLSGKRVKNSFRFGLVRRDLDNFIQPTEGTEIELSHSFHAGYAIDYGDNKVNFDFMESMISGNVFIPVDYTESFRTYFRIHGVAAQLLKSSSSSIPLTERYRLGLYDLRGFRYNSVGPVERRAIDPAAPFIDYVVGGDKKLYFQFEYYVPLIPQAGIKALVFADMGQVAREGEMFGHKWSEYKKDIGFGFRWTGPMGLFRFDWAYPYDDETGKFGDVEFILNIGR